MKKGFTLLELLITLTFIAIFIAIISYSASELRTSARVDRIINDLRMWKKAAILWINSHTDEIGKDGSVGDVVGGVMYYGTGETKRLFRDELADYLDNVRNSPSGSSNVFRIDLSGKRWYVRYDIPNDPTTAKNFLRKFKDRAEEVGLLKSGNPTNVYDGTQAYVYFLIADFN